MIGSIASQRDPSVSFPVSIVISIPVKSTPRDQQAAGLRFRRKNAFRPAGCVGERSYLDNDYRLNERERERRKRRRPETRAERKKREEEEKRESSCAARGRGDSVEIREDSKGEELVDYKLH